MLLCLAHRKESSCQAGCKYLPLSHTRVLATLQKGFRLLGAQGLVLGSQPGLPTLSGPGLPQVLPWLCGCTAAWPGLVALWKLFDLGALSVIASEIRPRSKENLTNESFCLKKIATKDPALIELALQCRSPMSEHSRRGKLKEW